MSEKKKATFIGGIFFKSENPEKLNKWYAKNLGMTIDKYGSLFEFRNPDNPDQKGYLQWSAFSAETKYFEPSKKDFMINYRVENLNDLVEELKSEGVEVVGEIQEFDYGKFAHVLDPEGNKIELWEPVDEVFSS